MQKLKLFYFRNGRKMLKFKLFGFTIGRDVIKNDSLVNSKDIGRRNKTHLLRKNLVEAISLPPSVRTAD